MTVRHSGQHVTKFGATRRQQLFLSPTYIVHVQTQFDVTKFFFSMLTWVRRLFIGQVTLTCDDLVRSCCRGCIRCWPVCFPLLLQGFECDRAPRIHLYTQTKPIRTRCCIPIERLQPTTKRTQKICFFMTSWFGGHYFVSCLCVRPAI